MALFLGLAPAACSRGSRARPGRRVGTVAGIVGAAGGLGGFFPPLIMGETYDAADSNYTVGLLACAHSSSRSCLPSSNCQGRGEPVPAAARG